MTSKNRVATFNLHQTGPLSPEEIAQRMPGGFRLATKHADPKATIDPHPCPYCRAKVEWAPTSSKVGDKVMRFVYARCQGSQRHAWSFRGLAKPNPTPPELPGRPVNVSLPSPKQPDVLTAWIDSRLREIETELTKLSQIRKLASDLPTTEHPAFNRPGIPNPPPTHNGKR